MKSLAMFLFLLSTANGFAGQPQPAETYKVMYLSDAGVVVIQMSVLIEGHGPNHRFEVFVDSLLKSLDKNNDGVVTVDEARGKILTAQEARQLLAADGDAIDSSPDVSPQDGKISRAELLSYFKRIGLLPFQVKFQARPSEMDPSTGAVNAANPTGDVPLFERLDVNGDKKLSVEELANALDILRKLDRDNDETISMAELQPLATRPRAVNAAMNNTKPAGFPFVSLSSGESVPKLIRRVVEKYDSADAAKSGVASLSIKNQKLSRMELGMVKFEFVKYDVDGDGQLDFAELRQFVTSPEPTLELTLNMTEGNVDATGRHAEMVRKTPDGAAHLQFGTAQISISSIPATRSFDAEAIIKPLFMAFDADANGYLEKSEASNIAALGAAFQDLDADKNGKLYLDEVVDYMKPRLEIVRNRVELSVVEQGRTLFDILDTDRDGRLAHREVRSVADKLALWDSDSDGQLSEKEIPLQFRMVATQGSFPNLGVQPAATGANPRGRAEARTAGPVWFRKMDRNSDGEISRREFLGDLDLFDKLDLNHDGAIELSEAMQVTPSK